MRALAAEREKCNVPGAGPGGRKRGRPPQRGHERTGARVAYCNTKAPTCTISNGAGGRTVPYETAAARELKGSATKSLNLMLICMALGPTVRSAPTASARAWDHPVGGLRLLRPRRAALPDPRPTPRGQGPVLPVPPPLGVPSAVSCTHPMLPLHVVL